MHSFSDCISGWSKEPQWENDCGSFLPCFLLVPLKPQWKSAMDRLKYIDTTMPQLGLRDIYRTLSNIIDERVTIYTNLA
jgi:hypothetical protein